MRTKWIVVPAVLAMCSMRMVGQSSAQIRKAFGTQTKSETPDQPSVLRPVFANIEEGAVIHYQKAMEAWEDHDAAEAAKEFKLASDSAPKNAIVWYDLAVAESRSGDLNHARDHLSMAYSVGLPKIPDATLLEDTLSNAIDKDRETPSVATPPPRIVGQSTRATSATRRASKTAENRSAILSPDEREAQKHYRISLEALKHDDFATAADELKIASELAPGNALIWYNLAVVDSKQGDSAQSALDHLQKATSLGLPKAMRNDADELEAKLSYQVLRDAKNDALLDKLIGLAKQVDSQLGKPLSECPSANTYNTFSTYKLRKPEKGKTVLVIEVQKSNQLSPGMNPSNQPYFPLDTANLALQFELADVSADITISEGSLYVCGQSAPGYDVNIHTTGSRSVHITGSTYRYDAWGGEHANTTTPIDLYDDKVGLTFFRRDLAEEVVKSLSDAIRLRGEIK